MQPLYLDTTQTTMPSRGDELKSIKERLEKRLNKFGIESTKKEDCDVCGYGKKITVIVNGEEKYHCRYCEDMKLAKELNLPTREEYRAQKETGFILRFERITNDLKDATVNNYKTDPNFPSQENAKTASIDFITGYTGNESLVLSGKPGIGKSHLSYAIHKEIRNRGYKTLFIKSTDLLDAIKETYNYQSDITQEMIFRMIDKLDVLVLDDLGGEYEKKNDNNNETWASDVLYKVLDMRLGKSLICTTNYGESALKEKYGQIQGERIVSRMMDNATAIRVEGKDKRRKERF